MSEPLRTPEAGLETDDRFPSGPWVGFFLQPVAPGRHKTELILTFRQGVMTGEGRDRIGEFLVRGRYQVEDGRCWWTKSYIGQHSLHYQGYNEGKGIWGVWEMGPNWSGGFHIWPEAMGDPMTPKLAAQAEVPVEPEREPAPAPEVLEEVGVGAGAS